MKSSDTMQTLKTTLKLQSMCIPLMNKMYIQNQVLSNEKKKKNVSRENAQFTAASDEKDQENN